MQAPPYRSLVVAMLLALALPVVGCGGGLATYEDSVAAWRAGDRGDAVARARATYERFRDDNDLTEAEVRAAVAEARERLDNEIVLPRGEQSTVDPRQLVDPEFMELDGPIEGFGGGADHGEALRAGLRADLLSGRATPTMRALETVRALRIEREIPGVISVIYRRDPIAADGGLLDGASVALRSVAVKRAALDVLEGW